MRAGGQVFSRIEFEHMDVEPFLRASAWLDACNHTGILVSQLDVNAPSCIAPEMIGKPYFAASIEAYEVAGHPASLSSDAHPAHRERHFPNFVPQVRSADSMQTREMWGHHIPGCSSIFNTRHECVVQIIGSTMGNASKN